MNKKRLPIVLGLALVLGLLAGYLALGYLRSQPGTLMAAEAPNGKLAIAVKDLPLGAVLSAEDVRLIDWPDNALPAGYSASVEPLVGRGLITAVSANEPLLDAKLASRDAGGGLPITIPEGMRAVSVKVDEVVGVAGFVLTGTRVDVLVTIDPETEGDAREQTVTRVILQNVLTLAAGQSYQKDANGEPQTVSVVTLLVTPEQAEQLTLAANEGRIQLALRNTLDQAEVRTPGIRAAALVSGSGPALVQRSVRPAAPRTRAPSARPSAPAPPSGIVVETIRGGERTLNTFSAPARP